MTDAAAALLLDEIIEGAVAGIEVCINIHLADVVEQIKIKIVRLTFFQLFFKDLPGLSDIGKIVAREF